VNIYLIKERVCSACHSLDGVSELIGPNLNNIGLVYSPDELLQEINLPSKRIKPGDFATKIITADGNIYLGRVVSQNTDEINLMMIGNKIKKIATKEIVSSELHTESLMYEGLLTGLEPEQIDALLGYLVAI
jgi:putative heme-binding domain-containing protein